MTNQTPVQILVVDDDEAICETLSAIFRMEGYDATTATTAKEALEKTKARFFDLILLDIKLPDMEGMRVLEKLQQTAPETVKVMITGYPSLKNAVEALNLGADSYIMKPIDPAELLKIIRNKLEMQKQAEEITKEKLARWIQSQVRKTQSSDFQEYLEKTSSELANFGLTKTQAKIYVTLTALGIASTSEIAETSRIRREEIYRIMPELEKRGMVTRKLDAPRRFSATQPEAAIKILTKIKLNTMKEEIDKLEQKRADLISKLKTIEMPTKENDCSIDVIQQHDAINRKFTEMTKSAKWQMCIMAQLQNLTLIYVNQPRKLLERVLKSVKIRIITEKCEIDPFTKQILQLSQANNNPAEIRQIERLPFTTLIVDDREAAWGENSPRDKVTPLFWTNDPTQAAILKTSFENLWQQASKM